MGEYQDKNLMLRKMQMKYSSMYYTLPETYKEKNDAYTEAFNTGAGLIVGYDTFIYRTHGFSGEISIGNNVIISDHCTIDYSGNLIIEDDVVISEGVKIYTHDHDVYCYTHKLDNSVVPHSVIIKNNAWIGAGSIILSGVTIGAYSVIGAGSVVTNDVQENCVFAGNPARYIGDNTPKK